MKNWIVDLEKGIIKHKSGEFFCIEGKRTLKSNSHEKTAMKKLAIKIKTYLLCLHKFL